MTCWTRFKSWIYYPIQPVKITNYKLPSNPKIGGIYRHYAGGLYIVRGFSIHTETNQDLVIYHNFPPDGNKPVYSRPLKMFNDNKRFVMVEMLLQEDKLNKFSSV